MATLAWNSYRHLECYFGVPCTGRILHTLNLRLSPAELAFIIADADDRAAPRRPRPGPAAGEGPEADRRGVDTSWCSPTTVPESSLPGLLAYEALIAEQPESYPPAAIDERSPLGLCYTSGTTGRPKGVVYTHRSTVPARAGGHLGSRAWHRPRRLRPAPGADVPRQRLGHALRRRRHRRQAGLPGRPARPRAPWWTSSSRRT